MSLGEKLNEAVKIIEEVIEQLPVSETKLTWSKTVFLRVTWNEVENILSDHPDYRIPTRVEFANYCDNENGAKKIKKLLKGKKSKPFWTSTSSPKNPGTKMINFNHETGRSDSTLYKPNETGLIDRNHLLLVEK
jgi:hypothetical protein